MTSPIIRSRTQELVRRITQFSSTRFKEQMQNRFGINTALAVGTPVTTLRKIIKALPRPDQELAESLWETKIHEARIMASMLADPLQMTREKLDTWVADINSWDLCDACALNLFSHTQQPFKLIEHWIKKEEEFTRRAGFATLAVLAMPRAKTPDKALLKMLPFLKNCATDSRPMVYKAVNWALRNIGKKNPFLTPHAITCANEILELYPTNRNAVWVAKNALWELNSPTIKRMIARRTK